MAEETNNAPQSPAPQTTLPLAPNANELPQSAGVRKPLLSRAPMVPLAIAMMAGIIVGRYVPVPPGVLWVLAIVGLAAAIATFRKAHLGLITSAGVLAAVLGISAAYSQLTYFTVAKDDIVTYSDEMPIFSTIRGQIVTSPMIVEDPPNHSGGYVKPPRTTFLLLASGIEVSATASQPATSQPAAWQSWRPASGLVRVTVGEGDTKRRLAAGQNVQLVGTLLRVGPPDNPGQVDWVTFGRENYTLCRFSSPGLDGVSVIGQQNLSAVEQAFWHVRSAMRQHLAGFGERDDGRLVNALITGERHPALAALNLAMVRAGVAHFLSISGQHLAIFLGFMYMICRLTSLSPRRSAVIVLALLVLYILVAEPNAPLMRSAIMAAAICLATIGGRQYSALNAIAAAEVIVLAFDPMQLFSAGFQLSFGIVAGMIVLHAPTRELLFGRWIRRRGLMVFHDSDRVRRWLMTSAADWAMLAATASINAYVVSVPLVAYHFGLFSPYASVLSIALEPLVAGVLVPGYLSIALAWPMPHLSAIFGQMAAAAADALTWCVNASSHLPGLCLQTRPVGVWWVIACYVVIAIVVLRKHLPRPRVCIGVLVLVLAGMTIYTQRTAPAPATAELNMLAVGDGQCAILRTPSGKTFFLDAGTTGSLDIAQQVIAPFLRQQRLPAPAAAFVSHAHSDHYNALPSVASLDKVYTNDYFPDFAVGQAGMESGTVAAGMMLHELGQRGVQTIRLRAGMKVDLDERTSIEVLWPPAQKNPKLDTNDTSLVLRVTCDGKRVLVPGDLDTVGQQALAGDPTAVASDVMILPHHGGWRVTVPALLAAVNPSYVIVSNSFEYRAAAGRDDAKLFYAKLRTDRLFYSTARNGWVQVRFGGGVVQVQAMR